MADAIRRFEMLPQQRVVHGAGSLAALREEVDRLGARRAFIITGRTLSTGTDLIDQAAAILGDRLAGVFNECVQHVPRRAVFQAAEQARAAGADCLISFGGGTPIDTAKGAVLVLAQDLAREEEIAAFRVQYSYGKPMVIPPVRVDRMLPHISVPTTISGGEYSHGFTVKNEATGTKEVFLGSRFVPDVVILDPAVTVHTPEWLWLATGFRSVDHCVEGFLSRHHHPVTDALALAALPQLFQYLPRCRRHPEDLETRHRCQLAAWMSIYQVIPNVRFGLSHALGHQIGGRFDIPHGITSCILLPHVLRFNAAVNADRQAVLADCIGVRRGQMSPEAAATALQDALADLVVALGLPHTLREYNVDPADFAAVAADAMGDMIVETNPRRIESKDQIIEILQRAW